jgi:hypothetical protein
MNWKTCLIAVALAFTASAAQADTKKSCIAQHGPWVEKP